jgi:hypothetical protein
MAFTLALVSFSAGYYQVAFYSQFLNHESADVIEIFLETYEENGNGKYPDIASNEGLSVVS